MERLTYFKDGYWRVNFSGVQYQADFVDRLAAYEDTGLTPERCAEFARADAEGRYIVMRDAEQEGVARLRELAEADKDGRVVVLPCKVGERWADEDGRAVRITAQVTASSAHTGRKNS